MRAVLACPGGGATATADVQQVAAVIHTAGRYAVAATAPQGPIMFPVRVVSA